MIRCCLSQLLAIFALCFFCVPAFAQETDRTPFALEFPELDTGKLTQPKNEIARTDVTLIKFWMLAPVANKVDWSKITAKINGISANTSCSQNAATLGKVMNCDLKRFAVFPLKPKDNFLEIEAVDRDGKRYYASFLLITNPKIQPASDVGKNSKVELGFSGRKFAVIIGISKYRYNDVGLGNLDFADADAEALYKWLTDSGGFNPQNILYMKNEEATLSAVRDSLNRFLTKAAETDLVMFFLAAHGTPDPFDPANLYYLVHDSKVGDLKNTGFPMVELRQIIESKLKSKRAVFFLDTCHSAGVSGKKVVGYSRKQLDGKSNGSRSIATDDIGERRLEREIEVKNEVSEAATRLFGTTGRAILTSSDSNETSRESTRWGGGHGVFTWALLEGLRGKADKNADKAVSTQELFEFVGKTVSAETKNNQNPRLFSSLGSDLILANVN